MAHTALMNIPTGAAKFFIDPNPGNYKKEIMGDIKKSLKAGAKQMLERGRRWRRQAEIRRSSPTITHDRLVADFRALGLEPGDTVLVHSSLKSLGYVEKGPRTVVEALYQSVAPDGTILFPAYYMPGGTIYETCKLEDYIFDPRVHGTRLGRLPEEFLKFPGVERSLHPTHSVAALGRNARYLTEAHHLAPSIFGKDSPWDRLLRIGGKVCGLGLPMAPGGLYHPLEDHMLDAFPLPVRMKETHFLRCRHPSGEIIQVPVVPLDPKFVPRRIDQRSRDDLRDYFWREFTRVGLLRVGQVGEARTWWMPARDFFDHLITLAREGITIYSTPEELSRRPLT
jgi:aminoglycoside 3-N-acetyltransferase